ncbi:MAG TPA: histidine phosphatase family protein [Bacteroidales bacterium]|nr:histidine phosphatase family protein [Bacteroidales bacterium]HPI68224.1 histidine phosphatase family protein [Bacteroidales bacterium]HPR72607.1 histidine phosphatase family protein [Bacteroidales bacterium]
MKKIIFIRHGRAEDGSSGINDFDRSLTTKGKLITKEMALRLRGKEKSPGLLITSPAFRALETAILIAVEFGIKPEKILLDSNLYFQAGIKYLMEMLYTIPEDTESITLVGHNPSFTEMADRLCIEGCEFMTKTSIVCISFKVSAWKEIKPGTGKKEYFLKPEK